MHGCAKTHLTFQLQGVWPSAPLGLGPTESHDGPEVGWGGPLLSCSGGPRVGLSLRVPGVKVVAGRPVWRFDPLGLTARTRLLSSFVHLPPPLHRLLRSPSARFPPLALPFPLSGPLCSDPHPLLPPSARFPLPARAPVPPLVLSAVRPHQHAVAIPLTFSYSCPVATAVPAAPAGARHTPGLVVGARGRAPCFGGTPRSPPLG